MEYKTVYIYLKQDRRPAWIIDTSERLANKIVDDINDESEMLRIDNVPSKTGPSTLLIRKTEITYVTIEPRKD